MGISTDYPSVPEWVSKSEGYQTGAMVKYKGNIFYADFWASEPGVGDADHNGWRFYDELYDLTPHTPTQQAKIIAYIPTWRKKEGFNYANDEMYQYITHGIIAFLMFSETNLGEFDPTSVNDVNAVLLDIVNTGHESGTKISIALGGATDYGFLNLMTSVGNNSANPLLDKAVQNVVNFVKSNDLDGVDLDLECWWDKNGDARKDQGGRPKSQGSHPAGYALTLFAQKLKQAMPDKLVSATLFGTSWYGNNYDSKIADYVDWLAIMTYDLTGSWNASPVGPHSALFKIRNQDSAKIRNQEFYQESYTKEQQGEWPGGGILNNPILSVEDTLWYWTNPLFVNWQGSGQNIPRNKIVAGVPVYGYDFAYGKDPDDLSGQIPPGYKIIEYKNILNQFPDAHTAANANIKVPGNTPRPPFVSATETYPYAHNIYFETPKTATDKLNFLKSVGVQGVIIWELSNDVWEGGKSVIQALYQNSGNPSTRPALPSKPRPEPEPEPKPELELTLPFPQELLGVFPDEWSENKVISPGFQDLAAGAVESFQVSRALNTTAAGEGGQKSPFVISGSPAVAVYNGKLYCVFEGQKENGSLRVCTYDGQNWSEDAPLPFGTSGPPALAEYQGKLYCVREGAGEDGWLWVCTFDGQNWAENTQLPFGTGSRRHNMPRAALAMYQERLYCVHQGGEGRENSSLWVCSFDGQNWSEDTQLPNHSTSSGPALAVVGDLLVCMHEASGESGTLMETRFDGNTWSEDKELLVAGNKYGTSGPPAMVVHNGRLYCVHEGLGEDNWTWSFNQTDKTDKQLTIGLFEKQPIGTSGPPALAVFNDDFILLHEGRGKDGFLWGSILSASAFPSNPSNWVLLEGDNSYCYSACSVADNTNRRHASNHTMNVKEGAPYLYAVLTKDDDSIDFPTGAVLTIEGPDGTKYERDIQEENQLVIMSGSSVRCLIVKDPKPGDWKMTMTVPEGVGFHCECNTVPSKDVYDTITETLNSRSAETGLQPRNPIVVAVVAFIGLAIAWLAKPTKAASNQELNYQDFLRAGTGDLGLQVTAPSFEGMGVNETAETFAESSRTAAQRQQTEYEYNLEMPERAGAPYNALDRYNTNLTDHQSLRGDNYPVEVMRHHIIPDSRLREFWNRMLAEGDFNAVRGLLSTLESNVRDYQMTLNQSDRDQLRELLRGIIDGRILHNPSARRPDGFDNLAAVYEWLPGNLFIGPRGGGGEYQRNDDPGDGFEERAGVVVNGDFQPWIGARGSILRYLDTTDPSAARDAIIHLSNIARRKKPFDIDPNVWVYRNKRYILRDS